MAVFQLLVGITHWCVEVYSYFLAHRLRRAIVQNGNEAGYVQFSTTDDDDYGENGTIHMRSLRAYRPPQLPDTTNDEDAVLLKSSEESGEHEGRERPL